MQRSEMNDIQFKQAKKSSKIFQKLTFDLTYGKNLRYYNSELRQIREIILYFCQFNQQILIGIDKYGQDTMMFEIKRITMNSSNYKYESSYQLVRNQYLILEDSEDTVILIFNSNYETSEFIEGAKILINVMLGYKSEVDSDIIKCFIKSDTNKNYVIQFQQLTKMFSRLKLNDPRQRDQYYQLAKQQHKFKSLTFHDFQRLAKICMCRKQFLEVFCAFSNRQVKSQLHFLNNLMKIEDFQTFLIQFQGQTKQNAREIIKKYCKSTQSLLSFYDFCMYILSSQNSIQSQQYKDCKLDLTHPLTNYYCHSSHNTYLTGDQLNSQSRVQRYYQDLSAGIRCVEIDCHEGDSEPIVKHGNTLTSSIKFIDVLKQIQIFCKQYNYKHTPIILSIENHCGNEYQQKMVTAFKTVFTKQWQNQENKTQRQIVIIPKIMGNSQLKYERQNMRLQQLMGKIIIKCSGNLHIFFQSLDHSQQNWTVIKNNTYSDSQDQIENDKVKQQKDVPQDKEKQKQISQKYQTLFVIRRDNFQRSTQNYIKSGKKNFMKIKQLSINFGKQLNLTKVQNKTKNVINKNLLGITSMLGSGSLGNPSYWESVSLSQDKLIGYYQQDKQKILNHTKIGWIRSYPKNMRFDSSNFNPYPSIEMGVQIIALNTQFNDYPSLIMRKFFQKGSKYTKGYRLKPSIIHQKGTLDRAIKKISITPVSASRIYYNLMSRKRQVPICQVRMRLYCYSKDLNLNIEATKWKQYTQAINNNAFNPVFCKREMMKIRYTQQQFAFVVVEIKQAGIGIIPIEGLKKGYRFINLLDHEGKIKVSKILFHIQQSK